MKICPSCAFANEERFPTCVWCNAVLVDVESTPAADPNHPEHLRAGQLRERRTQQAAQLGFATLCYAGLLTFLAAIPGMIFDPVVLGEIFLASSVVGFAVVSGCLGQLSSMFVQGAVTTTLVVACGLINPFTGFALLGHVVLPAVFQQWIDLIDHGHG